MAALKSRIAVRLVLVVILIGVIGLAVVAWKNNRPEALWERARTAMNNGDQQTAKLCLLKLLQQQPEHADAHVAMAGVLRDERKEKNPSATYANVPAAIEHLAKAAEFYPDDPKILLPLLKAYEQTGRRKDGVKIAERLHKADRNNPVALFWLARDAISNSHFKRAESFLNRLKSQKDEPSIRTLELLAAVYQNTKRPKQLNAVFEASLRATTNLKGKVGRIEIAALDRLLFAAVKLAPNAAEADRRLGIALSFQERRSAVAKRPVEAAQATSRLIDAYFRTHPIRGDNPKRKKTLKPVIAQAIALVEAGVKSDRATPKTEVVFVRLLVFSGDSARAANGAEEAIKRLKKRKNRDDNAELELHVVAAESLLRLYKLRSALMHAEVLAKRGRNAVHLSTGHLLAGNIHAIEGRHGKALDHFRRAGRNGLARSLRLHYGFANSYAALGRWQEARPHLEVLNINRKDVKGVDGNWASQVLGDGSQTRLRLAHAYLATGEIKLANTILNGFRGTQYEPASSAIRIIHNWKTDRAVSRKLMNAARAKFPTNVPLAYLDIRMSLKADQADKAQQIASKLSRSRPSDLTAQLLMYSVLRRRKDHAAAASLLDDLIKRFPGKHALLLVKTRALIDTRKYEPAADAVKQLAGHPRYKAAADYLGALAALRSHNLKDAADRLEAMQAGQRRFGSINLLRGNMSLSQGHPDDAIRDLTAALQYSRLRTVAGRSLLRSLLVLAYLKSPAQAIGKLDRILKQYPANTSLLLAKAELQSRMGEYAAALQTLKSLESANPRVADGSYYQARFWLGMNQIAYAVRAINRAVAINPKRLNVRNLAATIALRANRPDVAIAHLDAGLKLAPKNSSLLIMRATALLRQKKTADAAGFLRRLTADSPDQILAWVMLAGIHASAKRNDLALLTLAEARKKQPADLSLIYTTVLYLVREKKAAEVDELANSVARKNPAFGTLHQLAAAFQIAGDFGRARNWADRALAKAKADMKDLQTEAAELQLANLALAESKKPDADPKRLKEARDRYAAIVKKNPKHLVAANNLAWLLAMRMNDPATARKVIDPVIAAHRIDRLPAKVIETAMIVYRAQKDYVVLENLLKAAMRVQPGNAMWIRAYVNLALKRTRLDAAIPELKDLHRRRGWWPEPAYGLARIYSAMGRYRDALVELEHALQVVPTHLKARKMAVRVAMHLKNYPAVLTHAEAALRLNANLWSVHLRKARALKLMKRIADANRFLDAGIKRLTDSVRKKPSTAGFVALSLAFHERGSDDKALATLQDGLKKLPGEFAIVRSALGLLLKSGKKRDAADMLNRYFAADAPTMHLVSVGNVYYLNNQIGTALEWANRAMTRANADEKLIVHLLIGHIYLAKGQAAKDKTSFQKAGTHYGAVLNADPNHFIAGNNLAFLLATELDDPAAAMKLAERLRGNKPVERMHRSFIDTLSTVYRQAKEWKKARELLQQATATYHKHAPFQMQLAEVYIVTGHRQAAQRALLRAIALGLSKTDEKRARRMMSYNQQQASR